MKRTLLTLLACALMSLLPVSSFAQRYLTEVFSNVTVTKNIVYGNNFSVFPPTSPGFIDLYMDVYEPTGDALAQRPLIVFMHTGSFLPRYINGTPTGSRNDSATVAMCSQFAKRGYVVANMDYRLGWNPAGTNVDIRRGTILQAIYRAIQDAKACVRFFRADAAGSNNYGIDPNVIILGGQGTGGYIAINYACLDKPAEITLPKFVSGITDATYGFVAGQPYVNQTVLGDYDGYGGLAQVNNPNNSVGFSNDISFAFNLGGALGDSTWLEAGDVPMIGMHAIGDPFAPYNIGTVFVPGTPPQSVVDVIGSRSIIRFANQYGNNNCFANAGFSDPYTLAANQLNEGFEGLFPFATIPPVQAGPWEWYDSLTVVTEAPLLGQNGAVIYANALLTNPDMSKTKGLTYIDTIMNYINPRVVYCLNLATGINDLESAEQNISVYPNPAKDIFYVDPGQAGILVEKIEIADLSGRIVYEKQMRSEKQIILNRKDLSNGVYMISIYVSSGVVNRKLVLE